jgi:hypothetical protein
LLISGELIEVHPAVRIPKFPTENRDVVANEMQLRKLWQELDRIRPRIAKRSADFGFEAA